jgi:hypothetical protein
MQKKAILIFFSMSHAPGCTTDACIAFSTEFQSEISNMTTSAIPNNAKRFKLYGFAASMLGFGARQPLPTCIQDQIKLHFPSKNYTGFRR